MTTQEKIDRIYEVIADKTLSFGCILLSKEYDTYNLYLKYDALGKINTLGVQYPTIEKRGEGELLIIGHPVMLGDYLHRFMNKFNYDDCDVDSNRDNSIKYAEALQLRKFKNKAIEEQPDECIDFIYNLIKG